MRMGRLDHFVLTVADMAAMIAFYTRVLGMQEMAFGDQRKALILGQQKNQPGLIENGVPENHIPDCDRNRHRRATRTDMVHSHGFSRLPPMESFY